MHFFKSSNLRLDYQKKSKTIRVIIKISKMMFLSIILRLIVTNLIIPKVQ